MDGQVVSIHIAHGDGERLEALKQMVADRAAKDPMGEPSDFNIYPPNPSAWRILTDYQLW